MMRMWTFVGLLGLGVVVGACRPGPSQTTRQPGEGEASATVCEDPEAGEVLVLALRQAAIDEHDRLGQLEQACGPECGSACLEHGRRLGGQALASGAARACELGHSPGCSIAALPDGAAALCGAGEWLGCAAAIEGAEDRSGAWAALAEHAASACQAFDPRACTAAIWARCRQGRCGAEASELSSLARTMEAPAAAETHAAILCAAGQPGPADEALETSCAAGQGSDCERSCRTIGELGLLARTAETAQLDAIALLVHLQAERDPSWAPLISVMSAEQRSRFAELLEVFTPPPTEAAAKLKVPAKVREAHPVLVEAILRSPQVDAKKAKYWFGRLPDMSEQERTNLFESLRKQWWVIPEEGSDNPAAHIERVALQAITRVPE